MTKESISRIRSDTWRLGFLQVRSSMRFLCYACACHHSASTIILELAASWFMNLFSGCIPNHKKQKMHLMIPSTPKIHTHNVASYSQFHLKIFPKGYKKVRCWFCGLVNFPNSFDQSEAFIFQPVTFTYLVPNFLKNTHKFAFLSVITFKPQKR